jgi:pSer/pThr/pTyr-binding forkhead associated (FHA) protein
MEQARTFVCRACSTPIPLQHKFCGRCGAPVPLENQTAKTVFFGQLQAPGRAKLVVVRGEGVEGMSYQLVADTHTVGRTGHIAFTDDPFVAPKHAELYYRGNTLVIRDLGSKNGVYVRLKESVEVRAGDHVLAGDEIFRFELLAAPANGPDPDGTFFSGTPSKAASFRLVQVLEGGGDGTAVSSRDGAVVVGREGCDLNLPADPYLSTQHFRVAEINGRCVVSDLGSRNGTYLRIRDEVELAHGDYLFIGRNLLRVEVTA